MLLSAFFTLTWIGCISFFHLYLVVQNFIVKMEKKCTRLFVAMPDQTISPSACLSIPVANQRYNLLLQSGQFTFLLMIKIISTLYAVYFLPYRSTAFLHSIIQQYFYLKNNKIKLSSECGILNWMTFKCFWVVVQEVLHYTLVLLVLCGWILLFCRCAFSQP